MNCQLEYEPDSTDEVERTKACTKVLDVVPGAMKGLRRCNPE
jgi:hypothetical protein